MTALSSHPRPPLARGKGRMKELAAETAAAVATLTADLLRDLGREPSALDRLTCESLATAMTRARRLREQGKDASEAIKLVTQLLRAAGLRLDAPAKAQPESLQAYLARTAPSASPAE